MRLPVQGRVIAVAVVLLLATPAAGLGAAGPWVWPLDGPHAVSRPFDPGTPDEPGHRVADLPGSPGQVVRAAGAGRVSYAGLLAGRGLVVVTHGELRTTYEPVTTVAHVGEQVAAGAIIGRLVAGYPGCPGTCLHWGLLRGSVYLDPVRLVQRGPVRLLPLDRPAYAPAAGKALRQTTAPSPPTTAPRPAADPAFALRAADVAWGGTALVALVAGLVLLQRPRRPPDGPAAAALAASAAPGPPPVDLVSERQRRRPDVA